MSEKITQDEIPEIKGFDNSGLPTSEGITNKAKKHRMEGIVMGNFGIKETADCVIAIVAWTNAISSALEDGKITLGDLPLLLSPAMKLPAAFAGISEVPKELGELDEQEKNELLVLVKDGLDFTDDVEEIITKALIIIGEIKDLVDMITALNSTKE